MFCIGRYSSLQNLESRKVGSGSQGSAMHAWTNPYRDEKFPEHGCSLLDFFPLSTLVKLLFRLLVDREDFDKSIWLYTQSPTIASDISSTTIKHGRRSESGGQQSLCRERLHQSCVCETCVEHALQTNLPTERSSVKLSSLIQKTTYSTRTDLVHMPA